MTRRLKNVANDPDYETACGLSRGFFCGGNCHELDHEDCIADGCVNLRNEIEAALKKAYRDGQVNAWRGAEGGKRG